MTLSSLDGSAKAPADYPAVLDLMQWGSGETTKTVEIPIVDDGVREPNETFTLKLSNPDDTTFLSANAIATVLIVDSPGKVELRPRGLPGDRGQDRRGRPCCARTGVERAAVGRLVDRRRHARARPTSRRRTGR